jgi:hypothetical protein
MGTGTGTDVCGSRREVFCQGKNTTDSGTVKQTMTVKNGRNNT